MYDKTLSQIAAEANELDALATLIAQKLGGRLYRLPEIVRENVPRNYMLPPISISASGLGTMGRSGWFSFQIRVDDQGSWHCEIRDVNNERIKEFILL